MHFGKMGSLEHRLQAEFNMVGADAPTYPFVVSPSTRANGSKTYFHENSSCPVAAGTTKYENNPHCG